MLQQLISSIGIGALIGIAAVALVVILFVIGYLKAPPDTAYIISGLGKKRILIGRAGWRVPFFERVDKLSLKVMQVDVKTSEAVPTNEFINVTVDGVANIKISSDPEMLKRAAEALLGMTKQELVTLCTQVMEGNIIPNIVNNLDCIAHLHSAGHPGRIDLQFGENDYKFIFKKVDEAGYTGACGLEYRPTLGAEESLKEFRRIYLEN